MIQMIKIRCYPNKTQREEIHKTLNVCRWVWNQYYNASNRLYEEEKRFLGRFEFNKWLVRQKEEKPWLKEVSSKALQGIAADFEIARKCAIRKIRGFPTPKSKKRNPVRSFFFVKNGVRFTERKGRLQKVWVPVLRELRVRHHGPLPETEAITGGRILHDNGQYFILLVYGTSSEYQHPRCDGIGIDLGIESLCAVFIDAFKQYDPAIHFVPHFLDDPDYQKNEERLKRIQRRISHKVECNYHLLLRDWLDRHDGQDPPTCVENTLRGIAHSSNAIQKLYQKCRECYRYRRNFRADWINKVVHEIVAIAKPRSITIEDLDVSEMLKEADSRLADRIAKSNFYFFRRRLTEKCFKHHIELRIADKYFPSSKICSVCGNKKESFPLNERVYDCDACGNHIHRDANAAINLCRIKKKKCTVIKPDWIDIQISE